MARPTLSYLKNLILFLYGLPLGTLTGLTAIASSVFTVPVVRSLLGLRPARAVGTGLAVTFFTAFAAILSYGQQRFILVGLSLLLAICQIVGAAWGERVASGIPALERASWLWGTLVTAGGLIMVAQGLGHLRLSQFWHNSEHATLAWYALAALLAVIVGLVSRIIGLGGVLLVPACIYGLSLSPHVAQGTAIVVLAIASLPGMLIHARRGDVEPQGATWLSAGGVFGSLAGALWAVKELSDLALILIFGIVLSVLGVMMLWRKEPTAA